MGFSTTRRALASVVGLALFGVVPGAATAEVKTIRAVEVQDGDGSTRVLLRGAEDATYTAFVLQDPPRLIVELPDTVFEGVSTPISVDNGLVQDVTLGAFNDPETAHSMARVSIALAQAADYEVVPEGDLISIQVRPGSERSAATPTDAADPAGQASATGPSPEAQPAEPMAAPEGAGTGSEHASAEAPAAAPAKPKVSRILGVRFQDGAVQVDAEGAIDNHDSFVLANPDRIVVDFFGAKNAVRTASMKWDGAAVKSARIGQHADKVRLVLDLAQPVASHEVHSSERGAQILLIPAAESASAEAPASDAAQTASRTAQGGAGESGTGAPEAAAELPAAPAEAEADSTEAEQTETSAAASADDAEAGESDPMASADAPAAAPHAFAQTEPRAAAAPITGTAHVQSVHFESLPGTDRVVISLDTERPARTVEPDPQTLIVMLPATQIDPANERRVDTREFRGAIEMFSIFKTPDIPEDEVRLVLKRASPVSAKLHWDGPQLYVEVPRSESPADLASAPAAPLSPAPGGAAAARAAAPAKAAAAAPATASPDLTGDDPFLEGPADPAAIDILEEGGFDQEKQYQGRRISLDFKDADIANILRLIAEVSDLNVIAGEEVAGKVTIRLVDVPWDQALDVILLTKGLGFVRIGSILRIAPIETLKLEREARLQERRAREKMEDLVVKLQPVNFAQAPAVAKLVKKLLTARGSVNVDGRTNTLIIKDIPTVIHEATALVKALDTQTPQVMIEAKIVEASLNFTRALGSVWGAQWNSNGTRGGADDFRFADAQNSTTTSLFGGSQENNFISGNGIEAPTGTLTLGMLAFDDHLQLDVQIQAQEETGKAKVISSPRVVTMDNKEAVIKQGVAIAFESSDGDSVTTNFVDAVLELKVTPHITANKSIVMKIKVSRNAPQLNTDGFAIGIAKNETTTQTIVRDGETMVLGGIFVVDNGRQRSKVPFLADIPLLGAAFRSLTVNDERRELLIFVTPSVVRAEQAAAL
jgi:type IV pilus assembly protein PilQ